MPAERAWRFDIRHPACPSARAPAHPAYRRGGITARIRCRVGPGGTAPEPTGHGLPLGKCEAYNRVYDQSCGSS